MNSVLLVEDNEDHLRVMREALLECNSELEIIELTDGLMALNYLEKSISKKAIPDLILIDSKLPSLDGIDILKKLQGKSSKLKIGLVSFNAKDDAIDECKKLGAIAYITKPISFSDLKDKVKKFYSLCDQL